MSKPPLGLSGFLKGLPLAFIAGLLLWLLSQPLLDRSTKAMAESLLELDSTTRETHLVLGGVHGVGLRFPGHTPSRATSWTLTEVHFNFLILASLCLAMRARGGRRELLLVALAFALLHALHGIDLWTHVRFILATGQVGERFALGQPWLDLLAYVQHFLGLPGRLSLPLVLWGLVYWPTISRWLELDELS